MLEATKQKRFDQLFYHYNALYLIRRHFRFFGSAGQLEPPGYAGKPLLYIMNHSSWWDGLLAYHAARMLTGGDHYFMMEEKQLRKYAFFRKLGAYSIDASRPGEVSASMRYSAGLLQAGGRVWIYPEGEIRPLEQRPLMLKSGVGLLLRLCPEAVVVPVTLYHGLFQHSKPEATLLVGKPMHRSWKALHRDDIRDQLQGMLEGQLDAHRRMVQEQGGHVPELFAPLMKSGRSTNEWFDAVLGKRGKL
ncbi:lysophospholipid acyltransferase family protein [Paenibacillus sp. GCM10012306]|uniref:lysophospholipid acyltransferase family protein n=1 Tax=Paenibacillus sp. GCM10012306 TaxID=3317342 RepID=UPI0036061584